MSRNRRILFIGCFLIIDILLLAGFFLIRKATFKNILENEVNALVELDFTKDRFNSDIKSKGNYGLVETAIKTYLDDYAKEIQSILEVSNDEELKDLLTVNNYLDDGPSFETSFKYIEIRRDNFNSDMELLIKSLNEEEINEYIYSYIAEEEYVDLYHDLLLRNDFIKEINSTKNLLVKERIEINSYFDSIYNVLMFLSTNKDNYKIENNEIVFSNEYLNVEYNRLVAKTKRNLG